MEELKILQKTFDMINYAYPALAQYPKGEKFALVADIKRCMDVMLERIIEANKKYYKKCPCRFKAGAFFIRLFCRRREQ